MTDPETPDISIIIPAYNEAERLPQTLARLQDFLTRRPELVEIIVVVEKSSDGTVDVARSVADEDPRIRIVGNEEQLGKGYAVRCGMLLARSPLVFFMDADLSTPLEEIDAFVAHFSANPDIDIIVGSRSMPASTVAEPQSILRRAMGRTFNLLAQCLGVAAISDTQCGFKAFRGQVSREIFCRQKLNGMAFDVEVLMLAARLNYRVDVLPVIWHNSPASKVRIIADTVSMLWDLVRVRFLVRKTLMEQPSGYSSPE